MSAALLDTSAVIGGIDSLQPDPRASLAISVVTLGELRAAVRLAGDPEMAAARQRRLRAIGDAFEPIPVDESIAERYGDLLAGCRAAGRAVRTTELLIIATAAATGRVLHTLDPHQAALAQISGVAVRARL